MPAFYSDVQRRDLTEKQTIDGRHGGAFHPAHEQICEIEYYFPQSFNYGLKNMPYAVLQSGNVKYPPLT